VLDSVCSHSNAQPIASIFFLSESDLFTGMVEEREFGALPQRLACRPQSNGYKHSDHSGSPHAPLQADPTAAAGRRVSGRQEFAWNLDGTLGLQRVGDAGLFPVVARPDDKLFLTWVLRRGSAVMNRVLVTDVIDMWSRMTVVRVVPFLGGFLCGLHYLGLLILRVRAAIWDSHTAATAVVVLCTCIGSYCIYFFPSMRAAMRRRSVVLLSFMYHIMPCVSLVINAQVSVCAQNQSRPKKVDAVLRSVCD
jgi:hypothetical protein